jgi:hypothetical protein
VVVNSFVFEAEDARRVLAPAEHGLGSGPLTSAT